MATNEDQTQVSITVSAEDAEMLSQIDEMLGADGTLEVATAATVCERYKQVRPWLERFLRWVERIPRYGKKIGQVIRFLMRIADAVCG